MSLDLIQKQVDNWAKQFEPAYWPVLEQFAQLSEEVGEVAREINHLYGSKKKKSDESTKGLDQELVQVLFVLCCISNNLGINLQEEWEKMIIERQYKRDNKRFERKSS